MAPKEDKKMKKAEQQKEKKPIKGKDKKIIKKRCGPPIATGTVMAQRVLPPTVCCPPSGISTRINCLPGPGCARY